jgi:hypothetical protein
VAGVYAGVLLAPPVLAAVAVSVTTDAGALFLGILAVVFGVTVGATVALREWTGLASRLDTIPRRAALALGPLALVAGEIAVASAVDLRLPSGIGALAFVGALGGLVAGSILGIMARTRAVKARVAGLPVEAEWRAGWPERHRRLATAGAGVAMLGGLAGFAAGLLLDEPWLLTLSHVAIPVGAGVLGVSQPRTYRLTAAGVEDDNSVVRRLYPWETVTGYRATGEAVVLSRTGLHRPALRWDATDVEDVDELVAALDRYAPRVSKSGTGDHAR